MAANVFQFKPLFKDFQKYISLKSIGFVRNASGSGVSKQDHGRRPHFGIRKQDGTVVRSGTLLFKHQVLVFAPGLNVGIDRKAALYAKTHGRVFVTCEKPDFDPERLVVKRRYPENLPVYKKYFNVVPEPPHRRFKYIESY